MTVRVLLTYTDPRRGRNHHQRIDPVHAVHLAYITTVHDERRAIPAIQILAHLNTSTRFKYLYNK